MKKALLTFLLALVWLPLMAQKNIEQYKALIINEIANFISNLDYINATGDDQLDPEDTQATYGGDYLMFNGRKYNNLADWIKTYYQRQLGHYEVNHCLEVNKPTIHKYSKDSDDMRYTFKARLSRESADSSQDVIFEDKDVSFIVTADLNKGISVVSIDGPWDVKAIYRSPVVIDKAPKPARTKQNQPHYQPNELYLGGGYRVLPMSGVQLLVGGYLNHVNIELGYTIGGKSSETIYWYTPDVDGYPVTATYEGSMFQLRAGYGFILNNTFRVTPQLGWSHTVLSEASDAGTSYAQGAYSSCLSLGLKLDLAFTDWLALSIVPDFSITIKESAGYEQLANLSSEIKKQGSGVGLQMNLTARF